jgi:chemotaxis protein CheD
VSERVVVPVGRMAVRCGPARLVALGLGSCVAVVLHDPVAAIGGLAHVLLPDRTAGRSDGAASRFARSAVPALLEAMHAAGGDRSHLTARLVGGASMFAQLLPAGIASIGERNARAARDALAEAGIRIVGEAVGGDYGRSVGLEVATGRVWISSVRHGRSEL